MVQIRRHTVLATLLGLALACAKEGAPAVPALPLRVTAAPASAVADGASVVTLVVEGTGAAPVRVSTSRGRFEDGSTALTFDATPFTVTLHSCDASGVAACAGTAIVQVVDGKLATAATTVVFTAPAGAGGGGAGGSGSSGGGSGTGGTSHVLTLAAASARIAADGVAGTALTALVTADGAPAANRTVTFAQTGTAAALSATSGITDAAGLVTVTMRSDAGGGTALVTATDASGASDAVSVVMPRLGQLGLLAQQYQVQGVRSSGYQESNQLTFELLDTSGEPYPAGLAVTFSHQALNGSYLGASATCTTSVPPVCSATAVTDASGRAMVSLTSGRSAGVVAVHGSATAGGIAASGSANNIAIVGAKASGAHFALDCTPRNIPALMDHDCSVSHYAGPGNIVTCNASLADRFNNVLGIATLVTFASEAGSAGPPATTPQYDPSRPPSNQTNLGVATDFVSVSGGPLPLDVAPFAGEHAHPYVNSCGELVHNPRDGVVTIIATANGEEGFDDLNGNGTYDAGEPFIDMGEPYVDANDNGRRDPGETFGDLDNNGAYDGPNGAWDGPGCPAPGCKANAVIWAEARVTYTGLPAYLAADGSLYLSRFHAAGAPPAPTASPPSFAVRGSTTGPTAVSYGLFLTDENFNPITPKAEYSITTVGAGVVNAKYTLLPNTVDGHPMSVVRQYCNRAPPELPTRPCASTCFDATGGAGACFVVTKVGGCDPAGAEPACSGSGFAHGVRTGVLVTGACANPSGETVLATTTVNNVATTLAVGGSCIP